MGSTAMTCPRCGGPIDLGRVFCGSCGAKLDLSHLSHDKIPVPRRSWFPVLFRVLAPLLILLVVLCVVLALWPRNEPIGKAGTRLGARRADSQLAAAGEMGTGRSLTVWLAEEDVNGYFEFFGDQRLGLQSLRLKTHPGYFEVRCVRSPDTIEIGRIRLGFTLTLDMACVPVGNRIAPRRGSLGHLRLPGFVLRRFASRLAGRFDDWPEGRLVRSASGIGVQDGRFELSFKK
jgi:hypothetical protein